MFNKSLPRSVIFYMFSSLNHSLFTKDVSWSVSPFQIIMMIEKSLKRYVALIFPFERLFVQLLHNKVDMWVFYEYKFAPSGFTSKNREFITPLWHVW